MKKNTVWTVFLFILLGIVLHFESLQIGGIKISHLWKFFLIIYLIIAVRGRIYNYRIIKISFLIAVFSVINVYSITHLKSNFVYYSTVFLLPLSVNFFMMKSYTQQKILKVIRKFSLFFIIGSIPYFFNIIKPLTVGYDFDSSYLNDDNGFISFFQKPHGASMILSFSSITLLYFFYTYKKNNPLYLILYLLGSLMVFFTYVRTGLFVLGIGTIFMMYFFSKTNYKKTIFIAFIFFGALLYQFNNNQFFRQRIFDASENEKQNNKEYKERIGSGRLLVWTEYIEIFKNENIIEVFFGIGETESKNRMEKIYGQRLVPHNGFLEMLVFRGLIGVFLYFIFFREIIRISKNKNHGVLLKLYTLMYLVFLFVQGINIVYELIFYSSTIAINLKMNKKVLKRNILNSMISQKYVSPTI